MKQACLILLAVAAAGYAAHSDEGNSIANAEARAVEFLKREVPAWSQENGCFSCHNNGDAARALYTAARKGYRIPPKVLADTTAWITKPNRWEENKGDPGYNDTRLANVQFAAALVAAFKAGQVKNRRPLEEAARKVAADQHADGAWHIEPGNAVGSPATYGTTLATYMALRTLQEAHVPETDEAIRKANHWLRDISPRNVLTAATRLLVIANDSGEGAELRKRECLDIILRAQSQDGGWGPYADSPAEPFDTAVVLLGLAELRSASRVNHTIERGRSFLAARQRADGSWPATTRPPGGDGYAQRISTTGWATLALLATRD